MSPEYGRFTAETPHREADPRDYCPESEDAYDLLCDAADNIRWALRNHEKRSEYIGNALALLAKAQRRGPARESAEDTVMPKKQDAPEAQAVQSASQRTPWTKGPWKLRGRVNEPTAGVLHGVSDQQWGLVIWVPQPPFAFGAVGALICTANRDSEESLAIGNLMAAAPGLYEALERLLSAVGEDCDADCTDECCPFMQARSALATARGDK